MVSDSSWIHDDEEGIAEFFLTHVDEWAPAAAVVEDLGREESAVRPGKNAWAGPSLIYSRGRRTTTSQLSSFSAPAPGAPGTSTKL